MSRVARPRTVSAHEKMGTEAAFTTSAPRPWGLFMHTWKDATFFPEPEVLPAMPRAGSIRRTETPLCGEPW